MGGGVSLGNSHLRLQSANEHGRKNPKDDYDMNIVQLLTLITEVSNPKSQPKSRKALRDACRRGMIERVKQCVGNGVDVNKTTVMLGFNPLMVAIIAGHLNVIKYLVEEAGSNVNIANNAKASPLFVACLFGRLEIVHYLANHPQMDLFQWTAQGRTPLNRASIDGCLGVVRILVESIHFKDNEADKLKYINTGSNTLHTPFWMASWRGWLDIMQFLEEHGADTTVKVATGLRPKDAAQPYVLPFFDIIHLKVDDENWPDEVCLTALKADNWEIWFRMNEGEIFSKRSKKLLLTYGSREYVDSVMLSLRDNGGEGNGHMVDKYNQEKRNYTNRTKSTKFMNTVEPVTGRQGEELEKALDSDGRTLLHRAVSNGGRNLVNLLNFGLPPLRNTANKEYYDFLDAPDLLKLLGNDQLTFAALCFHDYSLWFTMIGQERPRHPPSLVALYDILCAKVKAWVEYNADLAYAHNKHGSTAMEVASKDIKAVMQEVLLWHTRYRITEQRPEHMSATCFVFKAVDDKELGKPVRVALKLMKNKAQFRRELSARDKDFAQEFVMDVLKTYPEEGSDDFVRAMADTTNDNVEVDLDAAGKLNKINAEKLFLLVMPLADRNLFVALKQERWAGKNMEEVRHVFKQLVHCVEHMHERGVLHADLKTLNIVRTGAQWKLIDLDAACEIGKEPVGHKSSSAYVPPEAIYVDEKAGHACVRSAVAVANGEANYDLLTAHPSFDVWSLGCILYQMCTTDVKPLFQGGQDDNLVGTRKGVDNLFALAEWSSDLKADKLGDVVDKSARNLLAQMLHKDPLHRPTLARVLAHPFLSGKKVARLVGEKPTYDVFLSYRVASDAHHVERLYKLLTSQGFKVYWDKLCLLPGVDWEQGFCEGLVSSRAFVPLLSRDAINHPEKDWQNFSKLRTDSRCDNVFLEHRLAVELQGLGLIEKIFPVFIGNFNEAKGVYGNYFGGGCHPTLPSLSVQTVEDKLLHHMESQALGTPLEPDRTIASVLGAITACQGAFIEGPTDETFAAATNSIAKMLTENQPTSSSSQRVDNGSGGGGSSMGVQTPRSQDMKRLLEEKEEEVKSEKIQTVALSEQVSSLKDQLNGALGKLDHVFASLTHVDTFQTLDEAKIVLGKLRQEVLQG